MLMRIEMSRIAIEESAENRQLTIDLVLNRPCDFKYGLPIAISIHPLPQVEMKSDAQIRMASCVLGRRDGLRAGHHQAGTRHDAVLERLGDAAVHAGTKTEVVRVHYEPATAHSPNLSAA